MALDFAAGCVGGFAGVLVGHPFDTIKVHLQTQNGNKSIYRGTWHCMSSLLARDSIRGLYGGITSPIGGVAFINAIVFGIYGNVQRTTNDPASLRSHLLAGSAAGFLQSFVCSPMELVKTRLQLQHTSTTAIKHKSPLKCLIHIGRTEGIRGVYRGLGLTALRDVPGFASYFVSYEFIMKQITNPTAFHSLIAGGLAGTFSWLLTFPIDVIKSCIQADGMHRRPQYLGAIDCMQKGYKSEGISFFCRGLTSTLLRAFPMNAACFFAVSQVMSLAKCAHLDIEIHPTEPMAFGSGSIPIYHPICHHYDFKDIQHQKIHMLKSLIALGAFSEAVCHSEIEDLVNEYFSKYLII